MAVVQYTGIVNQIRGKVNGSVFNRARTAFTLQRKQQPPKGTRGNQSEARNLFSFIQRQWKTVGVPYASNWQTAADNNPIYDRFGNLVALSGYNQFIKACTFSMNATGDMLSDADPNPAPANSAAGWDVNSLTMVRQLDGRLLVSINTGWTYAVYGSDHLAFVDISLPIQPGVSVYHGRFLFLAATPDYDQDVLVAGKFFSRLYPVPVASQPVIVRLRVVYIPNGAVVYSDSQSVVPVVS